MYGYLKVSFFVSVSMSFSQWEDIYKVENIVGKSLFRRMCVCRAGRFSETRPVVIRTFATLKHVCSLAVAYASIVERVLRTPCTEKFLSFEHFSVYSADFLLSKVPSSRPLRNQTVNRGNDS